MHELVLGGGMCCWNVIIVAYLWQGGAKLTLQGVSVIDNILQMLLSQSEALLGFPQCIQEPIPFVQHVDHQLLKVGVRIRSTALGAALAQCCVLANRGHHFTHHLGSGQESKG
ncbi:hypothetical protein GOODEAATRI_013332 [Goodea atripinnis]|uniref:Secreted protein n=1 Tax=Goodea atripinnis TaxID=208336 RepID=A0ABV0P3T2_9TELE